MKRVMIVAVLLSPLLLAATPGPPPATQPSGAEAYKVDPVHSFVMFRARHGGIGYVWGRFNDPAGTFVLDESDPAKSTFAIEIAVGNIDTHNARRDDDLKSATFLDAKLSPTITFKSTSVKKGEGNILQVTGELQMHGVTKTVTVPVELLGKGEFPPGVRRAGVETTFVVKMSEHGIKGMAPAVSDEIKLIVNLEGVRPPPASRPSSGVSS